MLLQVPLNVFFQSAKKKDKIVWTKEAERTFQKCKDSLADATLLAYQKINSPLLKITDASNLACGATPTKSKRFVGTNNFLF